MPLFDIVISRMHDMPLQPEGSISMEESCKNYGIRITGRYTLTVLPG